MSVYRFAGSVDHLMQFLRKLRMLGNLPFERECRGVKEPPGTFRPPIMFGRFPLAYHVGDTLDADYILAIHRKDGVVGLGVIEGHALVAQEPLILRDALVLQRPYDIGEQCGKFPPRLDGVLAPDDVIADEGEVVADEAARAERDPDGKLFSCELRKPKVSP
jgi:hypothetical protein